MVNLLSAVNEEWHVFVCLAAYAHFRGKETMAEGAGELVLSKYKRAAV